MGVTYVKDIPGVAKEDSAHRLCVSNSVGYLYSRYCAAAINLHEGSVNWLAERTPPKYASYVTRSYRYIDLHGSHIWVDTRGYVAADLSSAEDGALLLSARIAASGLLLWQHVIPIPEAASWAEKKPAWPGAQTEEIQAFFADERRFLTVCIFRQSRRSTCSSPSEGIEVQDLPPFNCQTDVLRFDPVTGDILWDKTFMGLYVGILERESFSGIWSNGSQVGTLDLESGENKILRESTDVLGVPIRMAGGHVVSWHNKRCVGVEWFDAGGLKLQSWTVQETGVRSTCLHDTGSGLALQLNDQKIFWFGDQYEPLWKVRAKPYVYRVFRAPGTAVFIGTDGGGGRLCAHEPSSGMELFNYKPKYGGAGDLLKVPTQDLLFAKFWTTSKSSAKCQLTQISMHDFKHAQCLQCHELLGVWEHGAICTAGENERLLAIVDVRAGVGID